MRKQTVKKRIFISNARMVLVMLLILLVINVVVMKAYSEYIEYEMGESIKRVADEEELEALFEAYTIRRNEFILLLLAEQKKNRKYEKARTDMIAGISHDLRTPLTAIRGTIKGLLDGVASTPECQKKFLETAYRRTGDMDLLLNQLFYLSKLETGNMPFDFKRIEISDFIRNYVKEKQETWENEQLRITADTEGVTGHVSVDPEQLRRIFDEFYRSDESRNKREGNGLGLYIVRYLTEAMGGSVRAENAGGLVVYLKFGEGE